MAIVRGVIVKCEECGREPILVDVFIRDNVIVDWDEASRKFDPPDISTTYLEISPRR